MPSSTALATVLGEFDGGDAEPYGRALAATGGSASGGSISGGSVSDGSVFLVAADDPRPGEPLAIARFAGLADQHDADVIARASGRVLDIGCGPGRLVRAGIAAGHLTLGVDISAAAVHLAQSRGLPVLQRSVFQPLPAEGSWQTILLIDGNIGIGGDPASLLRRCRQLACAQIGRILVETHADPSRDRAFTAVLVDDAGRRSVPFAWAECGADTLDRHARSVGLDAVGRWEAGGRTFAELALH